MTNLARITPPRSGALVLVGAVLVFGTVAASMFNPIRRSAETVRMPTTAAVPLPIAGGRSFPAQQGMQQGIEWGSPNGYAAPTPVWTPPVSALGIPAPNAGPGPNLMVTGGAAGLPGCGLYPAAAGLSPNDPTLAVALPAAVPMQPGRAFEAPAITLPFQEAHWQGLELLPNTATLARSLNLPLNAEGVIVDEATMPSDDAGFLAGDMVTAVGGIPTPDLISFIKATFKVRDLERVEVDILRARDSKKLVLTGLFGRVGTANGETAQTIPPGSRPPHGDQGACTNCHRIGMKGQLPTDQGDILPKTAPIIQAGQPPPHGNRGTCSACHTIVPSTGGVR